MFKNKIHVISVLLISTMQVSILFCLIFCIYVTHFGITVKQKIVEGKKKRKIETLIKLTVHPLIRQKGPLLSGRASVFPGVSVEAVEVHPCHGENPHLDQICLDFSWFSYSVFKKYIQKDSQVNEIHCGLQLNELCMHHIIILHSHSPRDDHF